MQAVNQLHQPSGSINSNTGRNRTQRSNPVKFIKETYLRYRIAVATVVYLIITIGLISACYLDNGYLLKETVSCMAIVGLLLVLRFSGKNIDGQLPGQTKR